MLLFLTEHWLEIMLSLITAGALSFCKWTYKQMKNYKTLLDEKEQDKTEDLIDKKLEPILKAINDLRIYVQSTKDLEKEHISLIATSYRYRLIQLCKLYIKQKYMTQEQYDQLTEFHKVYHGLGGNGQADEYYEAAMKLPIRD